ncbi:unnamed protein product [Phytophthora fragariaefolia]|uniref:Unnamed protein product n=1 Tax=Phytophthora fragariaefolia TaxID=1490495 RepID=A0A9W6Y340_9STRA|nr:unnamed protein product [Phytophthora fragariaefolia]
MEKYPSYRLVTGSVEAPRRSSGLKRVLANAVHDAFEAATRCAEADSEQIEHGGHHKVEIPEASVQSGSDASNSPRVAMALNPPITTGAPPSGKLSPDSGSEQTPAQPPCAATNIVVVNLVSSSDDDEEAGYRGSEETMSAIFVEAAAWISSIPPNITTESGSSLVDHATAPNSTQNELVEPPLSDKALLNVGDYLDKIPTRYQRARIHNQAKHKPGGYYQHRSLTAVFCTPDCCNLAAVCSNAPRALNSLKLSDTGRIVLGVYTTTDLDMDDIVGEYAGKLCEYDALISGQPDQAVKTNAG